jgi:hypothetical protein
LGGFVKPENKMNTIQKFDQLVSEFKSEYEKFETKGNKSAGTRARKAAFEIIKEMKLVRVNISNVKNTMKEK